MLDFKTRTRTRTIAPLHTWLSLLLLLLLLEHFTTPSDSRLFPRCDVRAVDPLRSQPPMASFTWSRCCCW